jgi:hypothetical protein
VPTFPATSQAWHCPRQSLSQHTPSAHTDDAHSSEVAQASPAFLAQVPFFRSLAHVLPTPHDASAQHTPSVQKLPVAHEDASVQARPSPTTGVHAPTLQ